MATPWRTLDSIDTDEGLLDLRQRGETDFLITIHGRVLMNASANMSEIALAQLACVSLKTKKKPRVLIGGLGMGFTLKAALDTLSVDAQVEVAELNPVIVKWCRGPLAHLTGGAVDDPRVTVVIDDVAAIIRSAARQGKDHRFDAIILDYTMPGMDGVGTSRRLRVIRPDVPLFFSSGHDEAGVRAKSGDLGMAGFVAKPYNLYQLNEVLALALNS